jgi:pimeloyl-ACP methyl ester carboxylesterase
MFKRSRLAIAPCLLFLITSGLRAEQGFFNSNGVRIHYTVEGKGEPVLLIHGFSVNPMAQWVLPGITAALTRDHQVIAMDCRGHGQSGKPHDPKQYGLEMVEDAVRLLDHLKIKKAHIVGYSMGGFIALRLAASHPDRALTVTSGGAGSAQKVEARLLDELAESLDQGKGIGPLLRRLTPVGREPPTEEQLGRVNLILSAFNDQKALAAVIRGLKSLAIPLDNLKTNKVPTLVIVGDLDPLKEGVDAMKGLVPLLQVVVIKGADHMNAFTKPQFTQALRDYLDQHAQKSGIKLVEKPETAQPVKTGQ